MIDPEKMEQLLKRREKLQALMSESPDHETYAKLASEFSELEPVALKIEEMKRIEGEKSDLEAMLQTPLEAEMKRMAQGELVQLGERLEKTQDELRLALLPQDSADGKSVILEVRAGTGGSEAALFAGDLFRMYRRHCEFCGWRAEVLSAAEGEIGGYREIVASVSGRGVFARLKFESGVHRVQRVPETESSGRVHTSAATVAVLPQAEEVDIEIKSEDLRIDTMRASGAGGQHVNKTDSAVRLTHIPSGIVVISAEKSQHQNRAFAMKELRARLYDRERQKAERERADERKGQVGSGDRSQRIRTYNYPQGRISDHRINLTLYKLERIMQGEGLDEIIDALTADHQAAQLAALGAPERANRK